MRKKLTYLFVIISIVVITLYLFRYKSALTIENKIPSTATEIVQINLRQIEHHLLVDGIKNPFKYISLKSKKKDTTASFIETIVIPKNLLFFTNNDNFKGGWFSTIIKLKDSVELRNCLLQEGFNDFTDEKITFFSKGKVVIAIAGKKGIIAYKKQQSLSVNAAIQTVFNETSFYKKETDILKSIKNSKSDITYVNAKSDFLEADFKKGLFEIKGKVQSELFVADAYNADSKNLIGFIATKVNTNHHIFRSLISDKNKTKFKDFTKLSIDSIVNNWNGSVVFNLKNIDTKTDTIITYEYDDDFNKIEKKSVQKTNIPNVTITLGNDANLYGYFYTHKIIQIKEGDTLFAGIPVYKMYARRQENYLHISSQRQLETRLLKEKQYKFNAHINIHSYLENPLEFSLLPIKNDYLQLVESVSAQLTINDELLIQLRLRNNGRNFLGQFIKP
ncbi:hypothetical protein [Ascidiimonas sp. W6]|uniref:hypothetical protein n=1 Tax=Ascidiimonas meishanensis TaxID=3128903 RepID=UPI0030EBECB1